jgi:hypothetical protein
MAGKNGSAMIPPGWIPTAELEQLGIELGVKPRRLEAWRERGLIQSPTLFGHEGKRPVWAYPPGTDDRLRSAVHWRRTTRDLESIPVGVWADGFDVPVEDVRRAIVRVLDAFDRAQRQELNRFVQDEELSDEDVPDSDQLSGALDSYADELARMRGRFPVPRRVEMPLDERVRGVRYWLDIALGLEPTSEDAIHLERVLGISRGRSGTAQGIITWPPSESFRPFNARTLIECVTNADDALFHAAQASLQSLLHLLRFLFPVLVPAASSIQGFLENAEAMFDNVPAQVVALLAAVFISNMTTMNADPSAIAKHARVFRPENLLREIVPELTKEQRANLTELLKKHSDDHTSE